jgi:multidrug efflux pump subunit AcrA (membrane-fusion protein)
VFVIDRGHARLRTVTIGQINEDWGEVRAGLTEGQAVILNPANAMKNGQRVRRR